MVERGMSLSPQKNGKFTYYIKIKIIALIIILDETNPFEIDKCKSKNGASISEVLALFNCSSDG